jgi:peptide chain release factor subunit 1
MEELHGIFVGGPGPSKETFVADDNLDYRLREKIVDVADIGYSGVEGLRALVDKVKDQMADIKYVRERQVMQKFLKNISNESGLATYGLEEVKKALSYGVVDTLIISEKVDSYQLKLECSNCGYSEIRIAREQELKKMQTSIQEEICPKCSSNTFNINEIKSIIEELGETAEKTGTDVEILSSETEEGESLYSTFGGIVAILRFKIFY